MIKIVLLGVPVVAVILFVRFTVFAANPVKRAKWRIKFLMHPGPGWASCAELATRWSRLAALHHGRRARPSLKLRHRLVSPTTDFAIRLGRGQWGRRLYSRNEDERLIVAAKRTGKSGLVADRIITHRGPVLSSTSRTDIYEMTSGLRARLGPVYRFNPMGVGEVPNDVRWDIMDACKDVLMARQVGSWLKIPDVTGNDLAWFQHRGDVYLGAMLYAAAISGLTIMDVYRWNELQGESECLRILGMDPRTLEMAAICRRAFEGNRTAGSVRDTVQLSLSWCVLPGLAEIVTPPRGQGFSVADFTERRGSLFLIATGEDDSPVTPLFRAITMWIAYEAGLTGSKSRYKRLDPPLLMSMDEVAVTNPIDLGSMLSDSSGRGILIEPVCHSLAQLKRRYGERQADDIWGLCGTKVLLGGISDDVTLDRASKLCGNVPGDGKDRPVLPPDLLRQLPDWRAVILRMNLAPAAVKIRPAWHRFMFRIGRHPLPAPHLTSHTAPALRVPAEAKPVLDLVPWPPLPDPEQVPVHANGNGHKPGQQVL
jgi:type IV secretion system protein VirD4